METPEIVITRTVHAPRQRVWEMFTQAEHIQHWWGPNGFTNTILAMDVSVGGLWRYVMHGPAGSDGSPGTDYNNWIRYTELTPPARMAYAHGGDDPEHAEFHAEVELQDLGETTQVTLRLVLASAEQRARLVEFGAVEGGQQTLERLDAYVSAPPAAQCFTISRSFNAPLAQVWQAWSEPERFAQWWGPAGCTIQLQKMDFRPGGETHYAMVWPGAPAMWGKFIYGEIVPQQSLEFFNSFANEAGDIARAPFFDDWPLQVLNTVHFSEKDGQTTLALRSGPVNATPAERRRFAELFESMTQGFGGTFAQLEAYLQNPAATARS